jgi:hypothetical protein
LKEIKKYLTSQTSIAPLAVFRVLFGFIMLVSIIRFAAKGWIYDLYIQPDYFFTYLGFDWVMPLGELGMYALFTIMGLAALCIMLGYYYRAAIVLFFLAFTYVELIDKTNYLNHYYFVSIISFLLMFVPAHRSFSLDLLRHPEWKLDNIPAWTINIFKLQLGIVYFFAGVAKLNPDWLLYAMPMKIWLPANAHLPLIGWLFNYEITAFVFSWAGALYDLTIVFFLLYKPTRKIAYASVILFHMLTYFLFQIGMFPFIMILSTLIFFSAEFHENLVDIVRKIWSSLRSYFFNKQSGLQDQPITGNTGNLSIQRNTSAVIAVILVIHFLLQVLLPLRFALYPGNVFWTEQGYRFSWRVMLMEKAGYTVFQVRNPKTNKTWEVSNWEHLTENQEKMMSTQPDMILQFAHYLENQYREQGIEEVEIRAKSYVTLNGRRSRLMVNPDTDLTEIKRGLAHKDWILPYNRKEKSWFSNSK